MIDYRVSYSQDDQDYQVLAENIADTTYTATSLTADQNYKFKVEARNAFGFSAYSNEVEIRAARVPDAPINLDNNAALTTHEQIGLTWEDGASDGGSQVIDYRISFDQGGDSWTYLATGITDKSFTATGLIADTVYVFKVESRNLVGYSPSSIIKDIRAAAVPT